MSKQIIFITLFSCVIFSACSSDKNNKLLNNEKETISNNKISAICAESNRLGSVYARISYDAEIISINEKEHCSVIDGSAVVTLINEKNGTEMFSCPLVSPTGLCFEAGKEFDCRLFEGRNEEILAAVGVPSVDESSYVSFFYLAADDFCILANFFPQVKSLDDISFDGNDKISFTNTDREYCERIIDSETFQALPQL